MVRFADLPARLAAGGSTRFRLAGVPIARRERNSARGSRFAFLQMSDASGVFEVVVFAEVLAQARQLLDEAVAAAVVTVDVRSEEESLKPHPRSGSSRSTRGRDRTPPPGSRSCSAKASASGRCAKLMARESGGRGRVSVIVPVSAAREVEIALPGGFKIGPAVLNAVRGLARCGRSARASRLINPFWRFAPFREVRYG